jgi:hypothetical protein
MTIQSRCGDEWPDGPFSSLLPATPATTLIS